MDAAASARSFVMCARWVVRGVKLIPEDDGS